MLTSLLLMAASVPAASGRNEIPIREVVLSNGDRRYSLPIRVGGTAIEAGLDSGSSGLRILPGTLSDGDARPLSERLDYSFGSGAELKGNKAGATLAIGAATGTVSFQAITEVGCAADRPRCAAGSIPIARYGIQGDGLPGEGFKALLGTNMAPVSITQPLVAIGASRWIIDLPRPGESAPGRLLLDPDAADQAGFVLIPLAAPAAHPDSGLHDAINGCIVERATKVRFCGLMLFDTGAPGIRVVGRDAPTRPWADGSDADLVFADARGHPVAAEALQIGLRSHASRLTFERRDGPTQIFVGLTPYFAFTVLYDAQHAGLGLRPRPIAAGGPRGEILAPPPAP